MTRYRSTAVAVLAGFHGLESLLLIYLESSTDSTLATSFDDDHVMKDGAIDPL